MAEKILVVDQLKLSYQGLFDFPELYKIIDQWFKLNGYDKVERMNEEFVTPEGKQIRLVLEPEKNISEYFRFIIQLKVIVHDLKTVEIEREGMKVKLNYGEIRMIFNSYLISDRRSYWEKKPFLWLLRILSDKYFLKRYYSQAESQLINETQQVHHEIRHFLNLYSQQGKPVPYLK